MYNSWEGIGRLAADPESRFSQSGMQIASFTVCCDSGYGDKKKTEFAKCTSFDKLAKICTDYLQKGSLVFVRGPMETQKWQDKEGNTRYSTGIIVNKMKMLSGKSEERQPREQEPFPPSTGFDVPF
jgi:single-strand DNA-binding protein